VFKKRIRPRPTAAEQHGTAPDPGGGPAYEPPALFRVGTVYELTRGSSASGKSDANSQYYW
jgi:hypothetical protein